MSKNFGFVKGYSAKLYNDIAKAESLIKTDYVSAGKELRNAFETFISGLVNNKYPEIGKSTSKKLYDRINALTIDSKSDSKMPYQVLTFAQISDDELFRCKEDNTICARKFNKDIKKYWIKDKIRESVRNEADFVRIVGNDCTHPDPKGWTFKRTYENVVDAFRYFHRILRNYYIREYKAKNIPAFNEDIIPIDRFSILSGYKPSDAERTGCRREYIGKYIENPRFPDEGVQWAIIREYRKEKIDENFVSRGYDTQVLARKDYSGIPVGMARIKPITQYSDKNSPFYSIAYIFQRQPMPLAEALENLSDNNKYDIAIKVADCFRNLHNSKSPIYHRMFNYNCVYLCDYSDVSEYGEWLPAITKFDFSKIDDSRVKTVIASATTAVEKLNPKEMKYISPEWASNPTRSNWEKVDIYSLGMLFVDIFSGKILDTVDDFFEMDDLESKVNNTILLLIDDMLSNDIQSRPTANEVYQTLIDCK